MGTSAIVVRQQSATPAASPAWMYSPDLLPFVAPATDTTLLTAQYGTGFAQAPVPGHANQVYVRGKNTTAAAGSATVTLYCVQHDIVAGMFSALLTPSNWDTSVFTVNGAKNSAVALAAAAGQVAVAGPAVWTPPALATDTSTYVLLAWVDGGGNPQPNFAAMQPFPSLTLFGQYVAANPSLVVLETAYSGMFARQYADQGYAVSAADATWNSSPDLVLYSGRAAYDTSLLKRNTAWSTHQPPTIGGPNNLYLRGYNTSNQTVTATVSFFHAVNNPTATPNPLLDPTTWKSDAMTVAGVAGSVATITGHAEGDFMLNGTSPVVWQPTVAPPTGGTYAVLAWIDNSGGSNPPPFATLPVFTSLASLGEYVQGVRNLVLWDGSFDGLFIRQFPAQTPAQVGTGAMTSPDIIVSGTAAAQDASSYVSAASYSPGAVSNATSSGVPNFVYLRALNPNNGAQRARVYLYWGSTTTVTLSALSNQGFTVGGRLQNWVDLQADTQNQVLVSVVPVVWTPQAAGPSSTEYLVTYVDGSANPQPPDFSGVGYGTLDAVTTFVATQPQLSWVAVTSTAPPNPPTWSAAYPATPITAPAGGRYLVGLQFVDLPVDGALEISVPGPNAANTIVVDSFHPPSPNGVAAWPATYPKDFPVSAEVNYTQGPTTPPQGANATFVMLPYPP